jgi:phosphatidyl-myo-inositol alpha-mannosyltransferase
VRIGLYTSTLPQADRKPGGADVYVDRLAERLARRGHQVKMFTYTEPVGSRSYELQQLEPMASVNSRVRRMLVAPARLNALDTSGLDVLHLHGDDWFYLRRRLPTVRTFHGSALYEARHAQRSVRRLSQYATYALELSASRQATSAYGVNPRVGPAYKMSGCLPLSIDLPPAPRFDRDGPPTVLFVGTWDGRKRGWLLHREFLARTLPRVPGARLVMVSDRCEPGPGVEWLERPSDEELVELYRSATLLCLPSSYEGFGLPYLEAMCQGTPVISTDNPGARYVLAGGRFGPLVPDGALGDRIADLLLDEEARLSLAHAGRQRAEQFSWDHGLDHHERAYRAAIERFRSGR